MASRAPFAFDGEALGSPLRLVCRAERRVAERAWRAVVDEFDATDATLSRFRPNSALAELNRSAAGLLDPPRRLRIAVALAWRAFRATDGVFDPRVVDAVEAAGDLIGAPRRRSPRGPSPRDRWLRADRHSLGTDAPLDLGGIGKGLALRWAADVLDRLGMSDYLVIAGGDVVAAGSAGGGGWRVSVAAVDPRGRPAAVLELPVHRRVALATSGLTRRPWHLIDPATSRPVVGDLRQVTVADGDPAWAEVLAKVAVIRQTRSIARGDRPTWSLDADGDLHANAAARVWTRWVARSPAAES